MLCDVCGVIELELLGEEEEIELDIDFEGEFISGATGEEYQKGYDEGYADGEVAGYDKGYEAGLPVVPAWTQNISSVGFDYTSDEWAEEETTIYIPTLSSMSSMFRFMRFTKIKKLTIKSDTPITTATNAFFAPQGTPTSALETLVLDCDFSQCEYFDTWIMRQQKLKRIEGQPFNLSSAVRLSSFSSYASSVEYFRVVPETIKVSFEIEHFSRLDDGTIQSIVEGLANLTGGTARTLALHANVKAKLTEEQLATITGKNWTLA